MPGCEEFEIAIEKRLHGALGDAEGARLDVHLPTCERCRAFEATARRTEAVMHEAAREATRAVDWNAVDRAIARWRRRHLASLGLLGILGALLVGAAVASMRSGRPAEDVGLVAVMLVLAMAGAVAAMVRRGRQLARASRNQETLALLRADLRRRWRVTRLLLWITPAYALVAAGLAATGDGAGPLRWVGAACAAGALAAWLFLLLGKRPMIRREQRDLDAAERR